MMIGHCIALLRDGYIVVAQLPHRSENDRQPPRFFCLPFPSVANIWALRLLTLQRLPAEYSTVAHMATFGTSIPSVYSDPTQLQHQVRAAAVQGQESSTGRG